jgi:predicted aspartyl protease
MALSFFGNPEAPVRCATEISQALKMYSELKLRMGLHSGVVQRLADINANMNIAGGGINIAQRVMDCGDAGHILLSKSVAEDLGQLSRWTGKLHDLGEAEVKHGVRVHIFNLYDDEIGNSAVPSKLRLPKTRRRWVVPAAALAVAVLVVAIFGFAILSGPRAQRVLNYSLTVQKMREGKPYGEPYESSGQEIYENGYKFRLNVSSPQSGYLYVFNEGAEENGSLSFTIIYPTPVTKSGSAKINEDEPVQTNWNTFGGQAGTEEFWIIWSASPISQLEAARDAAFKSEEGALTNAATVRSIKEFLTSHSDPKAQLIKDKIKQQTDVRTNGELLVTRLDLEHR